MKTNKMYLLLCGVLFLSSCWKIESDTCHKRVRFINNADFPIRVYRMWEFDSFVDCYAFGSDVDKYTLYPSDTAKFEMADDWECLESLMEYYQAHPEYPGASLFRVIYMRHCKSPTGVLPDRRFCFDAV